MRRKLVIALVTFGSAAVLVVLAIALVGYRESAASPGAVTTKPEVTLATLIGPDLSSPNWKRLSDDVGVMIRKDDRLGLRGRLYVRIKGAWVPVATDGPADTNGFIPVR
jgi:hypothetical protein